MRLSETEPFEFIKYVNAYEYDYGRGGWDYQLRDEDGTIHGKWVREEDTKKAWVDWILWYFDSEIM